MFFAKSPLFRWPLNLRVWRARQVCKCVFLSHRSQIRKRSENTNSKKFSPISSNFLVLWQKEKEVGGTEVTDSPILERDSLRCTFENSWQFQIFEIRKFERLQFRRWRNGKNWNIPVRKKSGILPQGNENGSFSDPIHIRISWLIPKTLLFLSILHTRYTIRLIPEITRFLSHVYIHFPLLPTDFNSEWFPPPSLRLPLCLKQLATLSDIKSSVGFMQHPFIHRSRGGFFVRCFFFSHSSMGKEEGERGEKGWSHLHAEKAKNHPV